MQIQALQKSNYLLQEQNSKLLKNDTFSQQFSELKEANKTLQRDLELERSKRRDSSFLGNLTTQYEEKLTESKKQAKVKDKMLEDLKEQVQKLEMDLSEKDSTIEHKNSLLQRLEDKLVHFDQ
jgi:chromosome segregation ATPase